MTRLRNTALAEILAVPNPVCNNRSRRAGLSVGAEVRGLRRSYKRRVDHHTHLIFLKNAHNARLATTINPSA